MCLCMFMCVYRHVVATGQSQMASATAYFLRPALSLKLELTDWIDWLANERQGFSCLHLTRTGITGMYHQPDILLFFSAYMNLFLYFLIYCLRVSHIYPLCYFVCFGFKKMYLVYTDECLPAYMSLHHMCAWCSVGEARRRHQVP